MHTNTDTNSKENLQFRLDRIVVFISIRNNARTSFLKIKSVYIIFKTSEISCLIHYSPYDFRYSLRVKHKRSETDKQKRKEDLDKWRKTEQHKRYIRWRKKSERKPKPIT